MIPDLIAAIDINIDPDIFGGGFTLTWHGFFTAVGIALGVWLSLRIARRISLSEDDVMNIALVAVPSGIVGARTLWVLEHTDQIENVGDLFAVTDGGISIYGAVIGGVLGAFLYVSFFRPQFPKWIGLDMAAPGMILGQAIGRLGDLVNGEHFAKASDLPWAFRYTHPDTEGPWAQITDGRIPDAAAWFRGQAGQLGEAPVAVHPVAGGYELILDLMILAGLLLMRRMRILPGWGFIFYVVSYAAVRGLLALLRSDEQTIVGGLSVPQFVAIITTLAAGVMAYHLLKHPQLRPEYIDMSRTEHRQDARRRRTAKRNAGPGQVRVRKRRNRD